MIARLVALIVLCVSCLSHSYTFQPRSRARKGLLQSQPRQKPTTVALKLRGGDSDDESDDYNDPAVAVAKPSGGLIKTVGALVFFPVFAAGRALWAIFDYQGEEGSTIVGRFFGTLGHMWRSAFFPSSSQKRQVSLHSVTRPMGQDIDEIEADIQRYKKMKQRVVTAQDASVDYGTQLADMYGVVDGRKGAEHSTRVLDCSFQEALQHARSRARLLLVYIPAQKPSKKASTDKEALKGLLSPQVSEIAEQRARKSEATGSYIIWTTKPGSSEAATVMQRLKVQEKDAQGNKRPILAIVYATGSPRLVPRLLAQHHCTPPPAPQTMAAWLNAMRKRHAKQYKIMQDDLKEVEWYKERTQGYKASMQSDKDREERQEREEQERLAREEAERARLEAIVKRRTVLLETLLEEPDKEYKNIRTIALRFADGKSGQRRFPDSTTLEAVFNWVDAMFALERERVVLTTMNGSKSFRWEDRDQALSSTGLARMAGLRVSEAKDEAADDEAKSDE
jgi:UBX domain